ncbi:MAG: 5-methyltetrahydropteroyltriglutamate--homocysteine S-methyltransferase, partial [Sulfurimonas sp.]|nr:5-methyltetrahydropteroyltriglutamate--homocysteine S-methyltransferase [Sulfurimonas sp.]
KRRHWEYQRDAGVEFISSNDFSLYDNMLDTSVMLGAIPQRFAHLKGEELYFAMARGDASSVAMEMTKWFNTNYHYIVPELSLEDNYLLNASKIIEEYNEAKKLGIKTKINIIGPITYLGLSKRVDRGDVYELWSKIVPLYEELLKAISTLDDEVVVQIDEPIFAKELDTKVLSLVKPTYDRLGSVASNIKIAVLTYFEHSNEATKVLVHTPIWALGLDFLHGDENLKSLELIASSGKKVIVGVVDGRNIWRCDIEKTLEFLENISKVVKKENILIGSSCSLLHTPFTLKYEEKISHDIKEWLSYALEKLDEISLLSKLFFDGKDSLDEREKEALQKNIKVNQSRKKFASYS